MQNQHNCCHFPDIIEGAEGIKICTICGHNYSKPQKESSNHDAPSEPKMPPLIKQAANLAKATVRHVANMGRNTPDMVMKSRLEICNDCDKNNNGRCSECGCFVDVKTSWASEACPLGHWLEYKDTPGKCGGCGRKQTKKNTLRSVLCMLLCRCLDT